MKVPPPDVPHNVPKETADYLRRLSSWADQQLRDKVSTTAGASRIVLLSPDGTKAYSLTISGAGALVITAVPLGSSP